MQGIPTATEDIVVEFNAPNDPSASRLLSNRAKDRLLIIPTAAQSIKKSLQLALVSGRGDPTLLGVLGQARMDNYARLTDRPSDRAGDSKRLSPQSADSMIENGKEAIIRSSGIVFISLLIWCFASFGAAAARDVGAQPVLTDVGGYRLNSILIDAGSRRDLPPIVFIHGASTSLYDPLLSFREKLEGRAMLLFLDRPGHGKSDIGGRENVSPDGQADAISTLMERRSIGMAIIVGHSFGGAIAAALAIRHPDKVRGLVFLSPAVYPWSSGVAWYYDAARAPVAGALFSTIIVPPLGLLALNRATKAVFAPNRPPEGYIEKTKALQAIRPQAFRHNAKEIAALSDWAKVASKQYRYIKAPTIIISGDTDKIVSPDIHARHLARGIPGSRLIVVRNLGHKSDYIAGDLAIAAIERLSGRKVDLLDMARKVEKRIANDRSD